jgi:hypothetical protein
MCIAVLHKFVPSFSYLVLYSKFFKKRINQTYLAMLKCFVNILIGKIGQIKLLKS